MSQVAITICGHLIAFVFGCLLGYFIVAPAIDWVQAWWRNRRGN